MAQPSQWDRRFEVLCRCLDRWHTNSGPVITHRKWVVGHHTERKKADKNSVPPGTGIVEAHVETCGRPYQRRIVLTWHKCYNDRGQQRQKDQILWSARISMNESKIWNIITPGSSGWTRDNRFASVEQLAQQRLAHLNSGERQFGIRAMGAKQLPMRLAPVASLLLCVVFTVLGSAA